MDAFSADIKNFLTANSIDISHLKFRKLKCFGGTLRIYTPHYELRLRKRPAYKKVKDGFVKVTGHIVDKRYIDMYKDFWARSPQEERELLLNFFKKA